MFINQCLILFDSKENVILGLSILIKNSINNQSQKFFTLIAGSSLLSFHFAIKFIFKVFTKTKMQNISVFSHQAKHEQVTNLF